MTVFTVISGAHYEGESLEGIYSSLDKARVTVQLRVNAANADIKYKKDKWTTKNNMNWVSGHNYIDIEEVQVE